MGVLRWQIALDAELAKLLDRPDQALPAEIRIALRMGAFQLRHMDRIPPHAALSESVELVRAAGHPKGRGAGECDAAQALREARARQANRRVRRCDGERGWGILAGWCARWESFYGQGGGVRDLRVRPARAAHAASCLSRRMRRSIRDEIDRRRVTAGRRTRGGQSSIAARIWDACAAPGGKTAVLARRHPCDCRAAGDRHQRATPAGDAPANSRASCRGERSARSRQTQRDCRTSEGNFDLILCDVPCSGTGTLARNPEIRHRLQAV